MDSNLIDAEEVRARLRDLVERKGLDIPGLYRREITDTLARKRAPTWAILRVLGLRRVLRYESMEEDGGKESAGIGRRRKTKR